MQDIVFFHIFVKRIAIITIMKKSHYAILLFLTIICLFSCRQEQKKWGKLLPQKNLYYVLMLPSKIWE